MQINDWLHNWLEHYVKPASKQKTYSRYCDIVFQHLIPKFGDTNLEDLTPLVLQQYISELTEHGNLRTGGGLSANTVNAIVTVIQTALQVAYRLGYLPEYTADKVKRPKAAEKTGRVFYGRGTEKDRISGTCRQAPEDVRNRALPLHWVAHRRTARA